MRADPPIHDGSDGRGALVVAGELDLVHLGDLRRKLMAAIDGAQDTVLVDLSQVKSIDTSCVGALLYANRIASIHGRELILSAPSPECRKALEDLGVSVLFTIREPAPVNVSGGR